MRASCVDIFAAISKVVTVNLLDEFCVPVSSYDEHKEFADILIFIESILHVIWCNTRRDHVYGTCVFSSIQKVPPFYEHKTFSQKRKKRQSADLAEYCETKIEK